MSKLVPMTQPEFDEFFVRLIREYAADNVRAGYWQEANALEKSRQQTETLLPQGLQTKDNYLFTLYDAGQAAGVIWLKVNAETPVKTGFIYDVEVKEELRGRGYGRQIMLLIEEKAHELGLKSIGLHVFGYNTVAKSLYESLGYEVTSLNMVKKLS